MTWNEFKERVDTYLEQQDKTGDIPVGFLRIWRDERLNFIISNEGRGVEEALEIWCRV